MDTSPTVHIPGVLKALAACNINYRIIEAQSAEELALIAWTVQSFPWGFSQIDWEPVKDHRCTTYWDLDDLEPKFLELVGSKDQTATVVVMWGNGICPSMELQLGDLARVARAVFEEHETSTDVLVFDQTAGWLIEMHHEGTLCIGSPNPTN